jgi:hypothetical protein
MRPALRTSASSSSSLGITSSSSSKIPTVKTSSMSTPKRRPSVVAKLPRKPLLQSVRELFSSCARITWKGCLKWLTRSVSTLITLLLFAFIYFLAVCFLSDWWWGVVGVLVFCVFVKFVKLR